MNCTGFYKLIINWNRDSIKVKKRNHKCCCDTKFLSWVACSRKDDKKMLPAGSRNHHHHQPPWTCSSCRGRRWAPNGFSVSPMHYVVVWRRSIKIIQSQTPITLNLDSPGPVPKYKSINIKGGKKRIIQVEFTWLGPSVIICRWP